MHQDTNDSASTLSQYKDNINNYKSLLEKYQATIVNDNHMVLNTAAQVANTNAAAVQAQQEETKDEEMKEEHATDMPAAAIVNWDQDLLKKKMKLISYHFWIRLNKLIL